MTTKITEKVTTQCGFCGTGNHKRCSIGIKHQGRHEKYKYGVVWVCGCECNGGRRKCATCGNTQTDEVNPATWECFDTEACHNLVEKRWAENPFSEQLRELKERANMAKVQENESKAKRESKPKTGTCVCGCDGTTKGGKFLPGHDARFVSTLVGEVVEAKFTKTSEQSARKRLTGVGASDALQGKFEKSLGIAKEKAEKARVAAEEKATAKAEKGKATADA